MIKSGLLAAFLVSAAPAFAQPPIAATPTPAPTPQQLAARTAGMNFNTCLQTAMGNVPTTGTPQQAADTIVAGCAPQQRAVQAAVDAYLATLPTAEQTEKREEVRAGLASLPAQIAGAITQMRAAQAAPAASATAQAPTPTPHR